MCTEATLAALASRVPWPPARARRQWRARRRPTAAPTAIGGGGVARQPARAGLPGPSRSLADRPPRPQSLNGSTAGGRDPVPVGAKYREVAVRRARKGDVIVVP